MSNQSNNDDISEQVAIEQRLQKAGMTADEAFEFRACYDEYKNALVLIREYDEESGKPTSEDDGQETYLLNVAKANLLIRELKTLLMEQGENVENFGVPRNGGIEKVLGNIYQTWDQRELYSGVEMKAVHLFYFLVKDHLFIDGNKRIASFLFLWFIGMNDMLVIERENRTIPYNIIYALAIFVAESDPKGKDIIVKLIRDFIMTYRKFKQMSEAE